AVTEVVLDVRHDHRIAHPPIVQRSALDAPFQLSCRGSIRVIWRSYRIDRSLLTSGRPVAHPKGPAMCVPPDAAESVTRPGPNRRSFLRTAGLVGAGAAAVGPLGSLPAFAADPQQAQQPRNVGRWNPDPDSLQFTLAVMPDTQFLYWGSQNSINSIPQEESFR